MGFWETPLPCNNDAFVFNSIVRKEAEHEGSVAKGSMVMLRGDMQTPTKGTEMVTPMGSGQGQELPRDFLAPSKNKTSHFLLK